MQGLGSIYKFDSLLHSANASLDSSTIVRLHLANVGSSNCFSKETEHQRKTSAHTQTYTYSLFLLVGSSQQMDFDICNSTWLHISKQLYPP